jgi:hypothetical protein
MGTTSSLSLCLAVSLLAVQALSQDTPATPPPTLQTGISQYNQGDLVAAAFTLEAVIRTLAAEPAAQANELSRAYLYRGATFVRLGQEENAKGSFAAALQYDKVLRITEDQFPPRVVRVFEAARTGKTKSVLLPPSNVAKKAGIGGLGIAGIVAGVAALGGGAAVATRSSGPQATPEPTPAPTPPISPGAAEGGVRIALSNVAPPQGSTISTTAVAGMLPPTALQIAVTLTSPGVPSLGTLYASSKLTIPGWNCWVMFYGGGGQRWNYGLLADVPTTVTLGSAQVYGGCLDASGTTNTFTTNTLNIYFGGESASSQTYNNFTYTWQIKNQ